jgi:uncharacterized protein (TIGR01777 family)
MTWQRTRRQFLAAPAADVWGLVGAPARWPQWCAALKWVRIDGPVRAGATGAYLPAARWAAALHGRTAPPLQVVAVDAPHRLVLEQPNPTGVMRVEWTVRPDGDGCELQQRITVTGALAPAVVLGAAGPIDADWREACVRLHGLVAAPTAAPDRARVVIAGGSGSLGRSLAADLACRGHDVVILTRRLDPTLPYRQVEWDGVTQGGWVDELAADPARTAVVNLAGRLVDARPTPATIADLRGSRVRPTRALVEASQSLRRPLAHWVQGSTTAIWSDARETTLTEGSPLPTGAAALLQMTGVAEPWEAAVDGAHTEHLVTLRTSVVLQSGSPAFDRLTGLTRAGLGGRVGSGRQWFSWIHVDDWLRVVRGTLGLESGLTVPDGVLVAAAPHPVRNADLMATLRRVLRRPASPPTPEALVRLGSVVLRTDPLLGLTGRHCTSAVLAAAGFEFEHPTLEPALTDLLS